MTEVYRKFGRTLRYENGIFVRIEEAGEAVETSDTFSCKPISGAERYSGPLNTEAVETAVEEVQSIVTPPLEIERLVVSEGLAEHEFGDRRWRETTRRVHLSIARAPLRAIIDLGDFDLSEARTIAEALREAGSEREAPQRIRLAQNVAAALLPSIVGITPPNVRLSQTAGGFDGKGRPIDACELTVTQWPNWYRPSYRSRPVRMPFHLRASCDVTEVDEVLPRAIALLAPPDGLMLRVLCVSEGEAFPAAVHVSRIDAIAPASRWYPYGAGSFGSEMML
ncbi:MAG TPA: hypothetical protein VLV78_12185 [Thermoanaerobaculia bacterium]|nr:hypothetical protein [Thermoanaerobaculia bacterium]